MERGEMYHIWRPACCNDLNASRVGVHRVPERCDAVGEVAGCSSSTAKVAGALNVWMLARE